MLHHSYIDSEREMVALKNNNNNNPNNNNKTNKHNKTNKQTHKTPTKNTTSI